MDQIAQWMDRALYCRDNDTELIRLAREIEAFAAEFPLFLNTPSQLNSKIGTEKNKEFRVPEKSDIS